MSRAGESLLAAQTAPRDTLVQAIAGNPVSASDGWALLHTYDALKAAADARGAALMAIIEQAAEEPGGLNFAQRAAAIARDALGWEEE